MAMTKFEPKPSVSAMDIFDIAERVEISPTMVLSGLIKLNPALEKLSANCNGILKSFELKKHLTDLDEQNYADWFTDCVVKENEIQLRETKLGELHEEIKDLRRELAESRVETQIWQFVGILIGILGISGFVIERNRLTK